MPHDAHANDSLNVASTHCSDAFARLGVHLRLVQHGDDARGKLERRLDGVDQPRAHVGLHDEPVDDHLDGVLALLVQLDLVFELADLAVDADAREALFADLLEQLGVLALAAADDRRQQLDARAFGEREDLVDDLLGGLRADLFAALVAVRHADARVQQPQVVVDLGDRADRRARVARGGLLVDRDRRRQPFDVVDVRLLHLPQELASVRRERLDVAPLALGVDGVERERGLARTRQARHDDELVARERQVDVLEVVLPRALDDDGIEGVRGSVRHTSLEPAR